MLTGERASSGSSFHLDLPRGALYLFQGLILRAKGDITINSVILAGTQQAGVDHVHIGIVSALLSSTMGIGVTAGYCKVITELRRKERRSDAAIGVNLRSAHVTASPGQSIQHMYS